MQNTIKFTLFGETLLFNADLKEYVRCKNYWGNKAMSLVDNFLEYHTRELEPSIILDKIKSTLSNEIDEIVKELLSYGLYSCDKNIYLRENRGYQFLEQVNDSYYSFCDNITQDANLKKDIELLETKQTALNEVKGLGFGVMTSSASSYLAYTLLSQKEMNKQIRKAKQKYYLKSQSIIDNHNQNINTDIINFYNTTYKEFFINGIFLVCNAIVQTLTEDLISCGKVSPDYIYNIDEKICNNCLENFNLSDNKQKSILTAIKSCPYSEEAYSLAIKNDIFCHELANLAIYFGMGEKIFWATIPVNYYDYKDIQSFIDDNKLTFYWLAIVTESSENSIYRKILNRKVVEMKNLFVDISSIIKGKNKFGILTKYHTTYNPNGDIEKWLYNIITNTISKQDFETFVNIYGESKITDVITEALGNKVALSFDEISNYCINSLSVVNSEVNKPVQNEIKEMEDNISKLEIQILKLAKYQNYCSYSLLLIPVAIIVYFNPKIFSFNLFIALLPIIIPILGLAIGMTAFFNLGESISTKKKEIEDTKTVIVKTKKEIGILK